MEEFLVHSEDQGIGLGVEDWWCEMTRHWIDGFVKQISSFMSVKEAACEVVWMSVVDLGDRRNYLPTPPKIQHIQSSTFSQVSSFLTRSLPNPRTLSPSYLSALVQFKAN